MGWLVSGLIVGPILYILVTLFTPKLRSVEDYQFGERKLNPSDVVDASIMYGLQIAAISLFATWGFQYGVTALVVPVFWAIGYLVFSRALSDAFLRRFVTDSCFRTLHGFIADHNRVRSVRMFAAFLTLVGLAGPAMVEAFTVGRSIAAAVPDFSTVGGAGLALAFLAVSLIYMTRSGFPGVVRLNQFQMMIGYGGFCLALAGAMILFIERVGAGPVLWLSAIGLIVTLLIATLKIRHDRATWRYVGTFIADCKPSQTMDILGLISIALGIVSFAGAAIYALAILNFDLSRVNIPILFGSSNGYGFTLLATLSLFVANAFYQFVDITQWQRLLSLASDRDRLEAAATMLRSNIITGGLCSALTWVLAIGFGIFLRSLYPDPSVDAYSLLPAFLTSVLSDTATWSGPLAFLTVTALLAIMFSTLDAIIAATAFTVQEDLLGIEGEAQSLTTARWITVGVVALQLVFYLLVGYAAGDRVDAVLYICWSFQLAMVPVVGGLLMGRAGSYWARIASMFAGCLAALSPLIFGAADKAYEVSPTAALLSAAVVYLLLGGGRRRAGAKAPV